MKPGPGRLAIFFALAIIGSVVGCAAKRPVLYPNDHLKQVGDEQSKADIAACEETAKQYASSSTKGRDVATDAAKGGVIGAAGGAVGGAIGGNPGEGAGIGA